MMPPTSIDGTDITGATIDGQEVQEITVDGQTVFSAGPSNLPVAYSNLVAWYPFDSATYGGSNADDVTAILGGSGDDTAYDGTVNGASYQSSGGVTDINAGTNSGYYDFDGSNDDIETPFDLDTQSSFTIMAYARFNSLSGSQGILFMSSPPERLYIYLSSDGLEALLGDFDFLTFLSGSNVNTGQWYHLALSYDGTTFKGYLDGDSTPKDTSTINVPEASENMYIGSNLAGDNPLDGDIDEVRVYNTDLSGSQINQIYQNTEP